MAQDRDGSLYQYQLNGGTLEVAGLNNGARRSLSAFTSEVDSFSLAIDNNSYALAFAASREVYFTKSRNSLSAFLPPVQLSRNGRQPALAVRNDQAAAVWEEADGLKFSRSADQGLNWDDHPIIMVTQEAVTGPRLALDELRDPHLIFLSFNQGLNRHRLYYTSLASIEPRVLFESQDEIVGPQIALAPDVLLISWQTNYLGRKTTYLSVSLDQGKHFGTTRSPAWSKGQPDHIFYQGSKWVTYSAGSSQKLNDLALPALPAPNLISPKNGAPTNCPSPEVRFRPNSADPVITRVDLSWEKAFSQGNTWSFDYFNLPGSAEVAVSLPLNLPDGEYYLRLSTRDGLCASATVGLFPFKIDTKAPVVTLASPSAEVSDDDHITFSGTVGEPAKLWLNGQPLSVEAGGSFSRSVPLLSGRNTFELLATDEAGNSTRVTRTISYAATVPHLKIIRPRTNDWFKPGSTTYFEAEVTDSQNGIEDEAEGEISVGGQALPDKPAYDRSSNKLSGFISLPPKLPDGRQTAIVRLVDRSGNTGQKSFPLNIDSTPPLRLAATYEAVYSGSAVTIPLPLNDSGSGLDLQGTMVKINGVSLEAVLTMEANPAARIKLPLPDGSYEVTVLPRDNVGNTGEATKYQLVVDTVPPVLSVSADQGTMIKARTILVSGEAGDLYLSGLNFYNGQNLVGSLNAPIERFTYNLPLVNGNNNIRVEAVDRAGNKTSRSLPVKAEIASAGLINKFAPAPCPFSPKTDQTMYFLFSFSAAPDRLKVYIFDLAGTLLWRQELINFAGNSLAWDGVDMVGRPVGNGVYPYLAQVTAGGQTEIKKGKLIVLQ